ncbi:MAG: D-glycerate dehydrogenase [bacterium]|nr:D-glycerate dehydrogenase [bacterium]
MKLAKPRVFVTRPIPGPGITMLKKKGYRVEIQPKEINISKTALIKAVKQYDAIITLLTNRIDKDVMNSATPQLKVISNYAVGYDNIDIETAKKKSIIIANTPCKEVSEAVAEHTFALILALSRRIVEADAFMRANKYHGWDANLMIGRSLNTLTLGVIGLGNIGKMVVHMAVKGMGMNVLYTDRKRDMTFEKEYGARFCTQEKLLKTANVISLHVPLCPSTRHLINKKTLRLMKHDALLINTARGPVVDETAILHALYAKKLGGYALDVLECEPHIDCNPNDRYEFKELKNVVMTPHIASASATARDAMSTIAAESIIAVFQGKTPIHKVV